MRARGESSCLLRSKCAVLYKYSSSQELSTFGVGVSAADAVCVVTTCSRTTTATAKTGGRKCRRPPQRAAGRELPTTMMRTVSAVCSAVQCSLVES